MDRRFLYIAILAAFAACNKPAEEDSARHEPGSPVSFGAESEASFITKTSYSGVRDGDKMEHINWIDGDKIHIYCAEAHATDADYEVTGTDIEDVIYHKGTIAPVAESMKWGETETHTFYSMYPAPGYSGVPGEVAMDGNVVTAVLPVDQSFATGKTNDVTPTPETYYANMNLAYMTAATTGELYSEDKVLLSFTPIVTTFYVTITNNYPDSHVMNLQQIILSSATQAMTGKYKTTITNVAANTNHGKNYTRSYTYAESGWGSLVTRTAANSYITYDWTGGAIASGGSVTVALFALPQDITQVTLTVVTDEGTSSLELKDSGGWINFAGGKKHNINNLGVPEWEYDIDICDVDDTPASLNYTYTAGDPELQAFSVKSRKTNDNGAHWYPTPWKAQYWSDTDSDGVQDDDEWFDIDPADYPAWLQSIAPVTYSPTTANYENTGHQVTMTPQTLQTHEETLRTRWITEIAAQTRVNTYASSSSYASKYPSEALEQLANGATARLDLSKWNFVAHSASNRTTANCYIVQGPGEYVFPMVYGNAIDYAFKTTSDNEQAYKPDGTGTDFLNQFRNHVRNGLDYVGILYAYRIKKPWLSRHETETSALDFDDNYGHHCTDVGVLWQEFNNGEDVITNVGWYDENNGYANDVADRMITFTVGNNISPGNALIYVKDRNLDVIAWTWHIWITDQDLSPVQMKNSSLTTFNIQPINLGWVDDADGIYYPPRTGIIRFVCVEHESTVSPTLTLDQADHENESTSGWSPYYQWGRKDPLRAGSTLINDEPHHIYYSIQNPEKFLSAKDPLQQEWDWSDNDYSNLWRAENKDKGSSALKSLVTEKTVHDPCPRGYKVPVGNTWTGLSLAGTLVSGKGRYFETASGGEIFFPAKGYINGEDAVKTGDGTEGLYWLDVPASGTARNSYCLHFNLSAIDAPGYVNRAEGLSVRCEREDANTVM